MKTPEDEAFDDLARRQGAWGGGYQAKRQMAMDKLQEPAQEPVAEHPNLKGESMTKDEALTIEALKYAASKGYGRIVRENSAPFTIKESLAQPTHCQCTFCKDGVLHASDCAVHNGPAYPAGPCDCGVAQEQDWKTLPPKDAPLVQWAKEQTAPPQRTWVGLTNADIADCMEMSIQKTCRAVEQLLKEKNT